VRRRFATQIAQGVEDGRGGSGIHQRVEKVPQGRAWRPGHHCHAIELRVHRAVRGSREELRMEAGEEQMEGESEGETEGRRGFQGEPLLGLPLGRVMGWPVRLAEVVKSTR
jgi:hypothetical protein